MDINERKRNARVKELMSKKNSPLVISGDTGMKEWNVKKVLSGRKEARDKIFFINEIEKKERNDFRKIHTYNLI